MKKVHLRIFGLFLLTALCAASIAIPLSARADSVGPTVSFSGFIPNGANGWYVSGSAVGSVDAHDADNVATLDCTDSLGGSWTFSGGATPDASLALTITGDGVHVITCNATDGNDPVNTTSGVTTTIKIDSTAPDIAFNSRTHDTTWTNQNVTVTWDCTDDTSGPASGSVSQTVSSEGAGQSASASCADNAGNVSATDTQSGINIDKTPPNATSIAPDRAPNAADWYRTSVTFTPSGNDALSGIGTCPGVTYTGPDGTGLTVNGVCVDLAGNTSTPLASAAFNYDATNPGISLASRTLANAHDWNNTNVTLVWNCDDATSGETAGTVSLTVSSEGGGQTATGTCYDIAGNSASNEQTGINIDRTKPINVSGTPNRLPDHNTWHNAPVMINFTGSDAISGIDSTTCTSQYYSGPDGSGRTVSGTCTDLAGNQSDPVNSAAFNYDETNPAIAFASRTPANSYGWNNTNVTVTWTCTDATSLVNTASSSLSQSVSAEGTNQSATGTCVDNAGNTSTNIQTGINIDKTNPSASGGPSRSPDYNGWYNNPLNIIFTGADDRSGIASCSPAIPYSGPDRENIMAGTGFCTDQAGNVSPTVNASLFKYDGTSPTAVVSASAPDHGEWYNQPLAVSFAWSDNLSGVGTPCTTSQDYSGPDGNSIPVNGSCTDQAGNSASASKTIKYDATAPVSVSGAPDRAADKNGWYNHAVNVAFVGNDATSGIDTCSAILYIGPDTPGTSVNGSCTDLAGNASTTVVSSTFKYDTTRPIATGSIAPANEYGWYNADVTVTFSGSDDLSGIDTCTDPVVVSTEGKEQSAVGFCKDLAGNVSSVASVYHINIDKTDPGIRYIGRIPLPDSAGWNYTPVTLAWFCTDALSGVVSSPVTQTVSTEGAGQTVEGICKDKAGNTSADAQGNININLSSPPPVPPTETATATVEPPPLPGETPVPATATSEPAQAGASATIEPTGDTVPPTDGEMSPSGSPTLYYLLGGILGAGLLGGLAYFLLRKPRK